MGRRDDAIRTLTQSVNMHPDTPVAHNNLAHMLGEHGDMEGALRNARRAVELGRPHVTTYRQTLRELQVREAAR